MRTYFSNTIRDLNKTVDALNNEIKGNKKDIDQVKNDLLKLMKKVNDLDLKLDALLKQGQSAAPTVQTSGIDKDQLDELKNALNELRNDYRSFKNEVLNQFNQVDKELDKKANKEDLENLRDILKNRLDELEKALNKTKNDLKRALRILNDKVIYCLNFFRLQKYQKDQLRKTETMPCLQRSHYKVGVVLLVIKMLLIYKDCLLIIIIGRRCLNLKIEFQWYTFYFLNI